MQNDLKKHLKGWHPMSNHVFRDKNKIDLRRQFIRVHCPNGKEGWNVQDLDLGIHNFGPWITEKFGFSTYDGGVFRMCELKTHTGKFSKGQANFSHFLDDMIKTSKYSKQYFGFFMIYTETEDWEKTHTFLVNGWQLNQSQFKDWLKFELIIPGIDPLVDVPPRFWASTHENCEEIRGWDRGPYNPEGSILES